MTPVNVSAFISMAMFASALPLNSRSGHLENRRNPTMRSPIFRRDGQCQPLTSDQAQKLPGFAQIAKFADDNFGTGSRNIVTNDPDFPDRPATLCVAPEPVTVSLDAPNCNTVLNPISGSQNTNGTISFAVQQGTSIQGSWSVTQTTSVADDVSFGVTLDIPDTGLGFSAGASQTTTVENGLSKSFSTTTNTQTTTTLTFGLPADNSCNLSVNATSCTASGTGQVKLLATGFVWFEYDDAHVAPSDPNGGKHFKYAASIEQVLTNEDDRAASMNFGGQLSIDNQVSFQQGCTPV